MRILSLGDLLRRQTILLFFVLVTVLLRTLTVFRLLISGVLPSPASPTRQECLSSKADKNSLTCSLSNLLAAFSTASVVSTVAFTVFFLSVLLGQLEE